MTKPKAQTDPLSWLFPRLEHRGQPLAPRWTFARRLAINVALGLAIILISLVVGMIGYRYFEGMGGIKAFGAAAMILGGMGPYSEPTTNGGEIFAGLYAIYCGLLLIGVTGLILSPVFHRVMHQLHLPDQEDTDEGKPKPAKPNNSFADREVCSLASGERAFRRELARAKLCASRMAGRVRGIRTLRGVLERNAPTPTTPPPSARTSSDLPSRGYGIRGALAGQRLAAQALQGLLGLIPAAIALLVSEHFQVLARRGVDDATELLGVLDHVMLAGCGKSRCRCCGKDEGGDEITLHGMHSFWNDPPQGCRSLSQ